jgi:hypothetical protein
VRGFLDQAYSYQLYFNLLRRNSAKAGQTPEQLRQARAPSVSPRIYLLPPVLLSSLDAQDLPLPQQVLAGHDVPGDVKFDCDGKIRPCGSSCRRGPAGLAPAFQRQ